MKTYIFKKRNLFFYIKIFFIFVTVYHSIIMFNDYLGFKYRYNLIIEDNSKGFEWKPLSVCTESKVLFDKHKVIQYFNLFEIYSKYKIGVNKKLLKDYDRLKLEKSRVADYFESIYPSYKNRNNIEDYFKNESGGDDLYEQLLMYGNVQFFVPFVDLVFNELNFVELNSLIVKENELFECSAKLHFNNQSIDLDAMVIENCFEYFRIETTVKADNTFGICYEFFANNSSIVMKQEDFVKIVVKIKKQRDFILYNEYLVKEGNLYEIDIVQYFRWYYFITNNKQNIAAKSSLITSTRIGLSAELKISKTSIVMLSVPYMTSCEHSECCHYFYKLFLDNDFFNYNDNTVMKIQHTKKEQLIYKAEPSLEFVDFISNIGGLFALYFGLSFIDISDILKSITRRLKCYLQKIIFYRKIMVFIRYFKLSHHKILEHIKLITKIPWNIILTILSSPFFVSQIIDLIINYFQYSTQISFEFVEYQQKNQKISINEFPAITVCTDHMFEKAFFDKYYIYYSKDRMFDMSIRLNSPFGYDDTKRCALKSDNYIQKYNLTTSNINILNFIINHCDKSFDNENIFQFLCNYFNINNEEEYNQVIERIEDKNNHGLNGTLDLLDFYVNHHMCRTLYEPNVNCQDLGEIIKIFSPFGKCHTYLMGNNNNNINNNNQTYVDRISLLTGDAKGELRTYLKRNFILHSANHLPIWTSHQFRVTDVEYGQKNSFVIRIIKNQFIKLPPPYDERCNIYSERQQFECMNKCIEIYYKQKFQCFPIINNYHTILVDDLIFEKNFVFCNNSHYISKKNELFISSCNSLCPVPCTKTYFNEQISQWNIWNNDGKTIEFIIDNVDYLKIIWLPSLTIISLFIKIFNIWSLWHGIHFKLLVDHILKHFKQVYSYIFRKIGLNINWKKYINYEIIKVKFLNMSMKFLLIIYFQKILKIYLELLFYSEIGKLSVEYLQFDTITNIEYLKKFETDLYFSVIIDRVYDFQDIKRKYWKLKNPHKYNYQYDVNFEEVFKCYSSFGIDSDIYEFYNNADNLDNDELITISIICNNITLDQIMHRNLFYREFLDQGIDIHFNKFIDSSRYSIGFVISQKIKRDEYPLRPLLTVKFNNVSYGRVNIPVSINFSCFLNIIIFLLNDIV